MTGRRRHLTAVRDDCCPAPYVMPDGRVGMDWSGHRTGDPAPCRVCGDPALCRDCAGKPCHKTCAEQQHAADLAAAVDTHRQAGRLAG
jgi:hypothetical protein